MLGFHLAQVETTCSFPAQSKAAQTQHHPSVFTCTRALSKHTHRQKQRHGHRDTDSPTDRHRDTDNCTETHTETQTPPQTHGDTDTPAQISPDTHTHTDTDVRVPQHVPIPAPAGIRKGLKTLQCQSLSNPKCCFRQDKHTCQVSLSPVPG